MAFKTAAGYGNLPNGNFSPVIYSKKVQSAFRKTSIIEDITNSDYFGEISNFGDTVRIIKEPEITVQEYARGTQVTPQDLDDEDFTLVVDKANYFAFKIDDIEEAHSHVNFESMATDRAGYRLKDQFDQEILGYMSGFKQSALHANAGTARVAADKSGTDPVSVAADGLLASMLISRASFVSGGATTDSIATHPDGSTGEATPLEVLNRMARLLDQQNVDRDNRWVVVDPVFAEQLNDENSKLLNNDFAGGQNANDILRNGRIISGLIRGFRVYLSNNLPSIGTGPGTIDTNGSSSHFGVVLAGHDSAVATASQIEKVESYRDNDSFADIVRGMHLYGRKILRPEALVRAHYNIAG
jgi:hypothetical protein|tara:strand:- start:412 stop:1479 length:1068 start_codon:yes stop_codon:yes gene_type:complete